MNSTARIVLIVVLVILLIGLLPAWPYRRELRLLPKRRARSCLAHHPDIAASRKTLTAPRVVAPDRR